MPLVERRRARRMHAARASTDPVDLVTFFGLQFHSGSSSLFDGQPCGASRCLVLHWLTHARPVERFVLIVESDMLLREPIDCEQLGVRPGVGASGLYEYLHGVHNGMARAFIRTRNSHPRQTTTSILSRIKGK